MSFFNESFMRPPDVQLPSSVVIAISTAGHPTIGTWATDQAVIDSNGVVWYCTAGGTPGTWVQAATPSTVILTASGNITVPAWANWAHIVLKGGGGGGSGGGSALTSGGVNNQVGGAGGGAGERLEITVATVPGQVWIYTQGLGGAWSAGAPANGNGSATAGNGGASTLEIGATTYTAAGGGAAGGAVGNSPNDGWGGLYAGADAPRSYDDNGFLLGHGGRSGQDPAFSNTYAFLDVCGGGAGSNATGTNGGLGGNVYTYAGPIWVPANGGSATATGGSGANATIPGCGGGGGGGGAPGGAGGNGGAGAPGQVTVTFRC